MPNKHPDIFYEIDPPPGGLNRLRRRLAKEREQPHSALPLRLALGASLAGILLVMGIAFMRPEATSTQHSFVLSAATNPAVLRYIQGSRNILDAKKDLSPQKNNLTQVPSPNGNVIFYWASTSHN